jgi:hypothetical protein
MMNTSRHRGLAVKELAHLLPSSHDRARTVINDRFGQLMSDPGSREFADRTETEQP